MTDLRASFRRPFAEQVAAFRLRLATLAPTARWDDLWQAEHDRAFMVAGAVKADLLADLGAAVDRAITEGTGFEAFQRDFRAIVEKNGWHGWTGEGTAKGEAWRMRVIYRTNMATSYAAGRLAQLVEGNFAFWVYRHGGSREPRLQHLGWNGVALPPDHPFWVTHGPPNGWGCSCYVTGARSEAGVRRVGGDPGKILPEGWATPDPRTGAPAGIDKGWDYAPGASVARTVATVSEKLVDWPYDIGKAYQQALPDGPRDAVAAAYRDLPSSRDALRLYAERVLGQRNGAPITGPVVVEPLRTLGLATRSQVTELQKLTGQQVAGSDFVLEAGAVREAVTSLSVATAGQTEALRPVEVADFARLGALINAPDSVTVERHPVLGLVLNYQKQFGAERLSALFDLRPLQLRIALLRIWVERADGRSPP